MAPLEFTGERFIPGKTSQKIHFEHLHRYIFAKAFVAQKMVLDIGCGEGYGSFLFSGKASRVIGFDLSLDAVRHAKQKYISKNLQFLVSPADLVPFRDNTFDVVVVFELIEHITNHEGLLREIKRVLKKEGLLIISTPDKKNYSDERNFINPYHVKELYATEFEVLLKDYFSKVILYGQKVITGSVLWPINPLSQNPFLNYFEIDINNPVKGKSEPINITDLGKPQYIIAVCSNLSATVNFNNSSEEIFSVAADNYLGSPEELLNRLEDLERLVGRVKNAFFYKVYRKFKDFLEWFKKRG